jgi:hypothetical protein
MGDGFVIRKSLALLNLSSEIGASLYTEISPTSKTPTWRSGRAAPMFPKELAGAEN